MKSTTIRFADPVYAGLVQASKLTGLPINSIVTVACLEWLRGNAAAGAPDPMAAMMSLRTGALRMLERPAELRAQPAWREDPLVALTTSAQDALAQAQDIAERAREPWIGTRHLLLGLAGV